MHSVKGNWGIDTVSIRVPIDYEQSAPDPAVWSASYAHGTKKNVDIEEHRGTFQLLDGPVHVVLNSLYRTATITFNAARVLGLPPPTLLPPDALQTVSGRVIKETPDIYPRFVGHASDGEGWPDTWAEDVQVARLDVAINLEVPAERVDLLQRALADASSRSTVYRGKGGWALENRLKTSGKDHLYDKSAQMGERHDGSRLYRFEVQAKGKRLTDTNQRWLSDVSSESAWRMLKRRFHLLKFDVGIPVPIRRSEMYQSVPKEDRVALDAYMTAASEGDKSLFSIREAKRLNALARQHGLRPRIPLAQQSALIGWLDLDEGGWVEEHARLDAAKAG